ncbi:hypothetical protein [Streptomyces sp. WAC 06738]|uniref:hypothetical protein n=1 Tax=Streptomyces sp. WAC 06738 TaxID=2203210 RepID=UPI0013DEAE73|nr:hypothetical protein [Streptomyces sp. WAC 06738]
MAEIDARTNPLKRWLRKTNLTVPQRASQRAGFVHLADRGVDQALELLRQTMELSR